MSSGLEGLYSVEPCLCTQFSFVVWHLFTSGADPSTTLLFRTSLRGSYGPLSGLRNVVIALAEQQQ